MTDVMQPGPSGQMPGFKRPLATDMPGYHAPRRHRGGKHKKFDVGFEEEHRRTKQHFGGMEQQHHDTLLDLECVNRVTHLPLVASLLGYAQGILEIAKESRLPLVGRVAEAAEATAKSALHQTQPVVDFLEGPIHLTDSLVCKALDVFETAVPVVYQTPDEIVEHTKSYIVEKTRPTVELFTVAKDIGVAVAGEAVHQGKELLDTSAAVASTAVDVAGQATEFGIEKTAEAAQFGMEKASQAMEFGMETAGHAAEAGMEAAGMAVEFGKDQALKVARTRYGQMAAKQLDKAAVMADTMAEEYMPPELAAKAKKLGAIDAAKFTEGWEPELKPVAHATAVGMNLFRKLMVFFFLPWDIFKAMATMAMMPLIHPLNFADRMITNAFRAPPVMVKMAKDCFNIAMAFAPWNMLNTSMAVLSWGAENFTGVVRKVIQYLYFNFVPDEVIEAVRQTRTGLEKTKLMPPGLGEVLPSTGKEEKHEGGEASGYHSAEEHPASPVSEEHAEEAKPSPAKHEEAHPHRRHKQGKHEEHKKHEHEAKPEGRRHEKHEPKLWSDILDMGAKKEEKKETAPPAPKKEEHKPEPTEKMPFAGPMEGEAKPMEEKPLAGPTEGETMPKPQEEEAKPEAGERKGLEIEGDSAIHEMSADTSAGSTEFFHPAPPPEGMTYERMMSDEGWRRENMPSVPLDRKSPTHHDVVEEGVIPETLPQLVRDEPNLGRPLEDGDYQQQQENINKAEPSWTSTPQPTTGME